MEKTLHAYVNEVKSEYHDLMLEYDNPQVACTILQFATQMRNTDNMNQNITANMNITGVEE